MTDHLTDEEQWYRDDFCQEFDRTIEGLHALPPFIKTNVGLDLLMVNGLFFEHFGTVDGFMAYPPERRLAYIQTMVKFEDEFYEEDINNIAFSFGLFRMWVCAVSQGDDAMSERFYSALNYFMDLGRQAELDNLTTQAPDPSQRH